MLDSSLPPPLAVAIKTAIVCCQSLALLWHQRVRSASAAELITICLRVTIEHTIIHGFGNSFVYSDAFTSWREQLLIAPFAS